MIYTSFNDFLKNYGVWIALLLCVIILLVVLCIFLSNNKKKNGETKIKQIFDDFISSIGGLDNILESSYKGSRLSLVLKDYGLIDEKKLETLGASSFIKMSNKITIVTNEAEQISQYINHCKN